MTLEQRIAEAMVAFDDHEGLDTSAYDSVFDDYYARAARHILAALVENREVVVRALYGNEAEPYAACKRCARVGVLNMAQCPKYPEGGCPQRGVLVLPLEDAS